MAKTSQSTHECREKWTTHLQPELWADSQHCVLPGTGKVLHQELQFLEPVISFRQEQAPAGLLRQQSKGWHWCATSKAGLCTDWTTSSLLSTWKLQAKVQTCNKTPDTWKPSHCASGLQSSGEGYCLSQARADHFKRSHSCPWLCWLLAKGCGLQQGRWPVPAHQASGGATCLGQERGMSW